MSAAAATAFPLLALPEEILTRTVEELTMLELFELSQCSREALEVVRKRAMAYSRQLEVSITIEAGVKLELMNKNGFGYQRSRNWLSLNFYGRRNPGLLDLEDVRKYRFGGEALEFSRCDHNPPSYHCASVLQLPDILRFSETLITLFSAKLSSLKITVESGVLEALESSPLLRAARNVSFEQQKLSHGEMRQVLRGFADWESLSLCCKPRKGFLYEGLISTQYLRIYDGSWLKRANLWNLDCSRVQLDNCTFKSEDLNWFLRYWIESGDRKLEYISIRSKWSRLDEDWKEEEAYDVREILRGLNAVPGAIKRPGATSFFQYRSQVPYEDGFDLRRPSDGMLGTILVSTFATVDSFLFVAWQESQPNL